MIDISEKRSTLRRAVAGAKVFCRPETIRRLREGTVPKGDVLAMSRAVGLLAIKQTPQLLPFCHPIPVERADVTFAVEDDGIVIRVDATCIARTGIEVEAMTAASLTALNVYDMLKPIDDAVSIGEIRVLEKHGGKSDFVGAKRPLRAALLLIGDDYLSGAREGDVLDAVAETLTEAGAEVVARGTIGDDPEAIRQWVLAQKGQADVVFTLGSTGLGPRDCAVEALADLGRDVPGIAEAMRSYGLERTPWAAFSRQCARQLDDLVVITLPGSTRGAAESLAALWPWLQHLTRILDKGWRKA